jgi:formylglycine-generating enzyme required for sulfatase activity
MRRGPLVSLAALILVALVAQVGVAAGASGSDEPRGAASAVSNKKFKRLKRQVAALQQQVDQLSRQPGPQGPQGPAGTAPACQGNGSGDQMVAAGPVCIDRYEVSVWSSPTGGTQFGVGGTDDYPCDDDGQNCTNIYARSVPGVRPSGTITWFQAQQALANVGKRLPSSAEWQQAAAGTPDAGTDNGTSDCNTDSAADSVDTGSRTACVSRFGAFDMVGNVWEWVADWVPSSTACPGWGSFGNFSTDDSMCLAGASTATGGPGALIRGGAFDSGIGGGPFSVNARDFHPQDAGSITGFRGAH